MPRTARLEPLPPTPMGRPPGRTPATRGRSRSHRGGVVQVHALPLEQRFVEPDHRFAHPGLVHDEGRLTREAPCEMSDTLMSETVANTRAAIPGVVRRPSPTTQTMARPDSTDTVPNGRNSATISGSDSTSSTVSDTLTSEVVTTSTTVRCRSNTSNNPRRKP